MDPMEPIVQINCSDDGEHELIIAEPLETNDDSINVSSFALEGSEMESNFVEERKYQCKQCNRRCRTLVQLNNHMNIHSVAKPFWCLLCEYKCRNKANLKSHLRSHSDERPHACQYCPYRSKTHVNLKNHLRKHTGEKPYSCTVCFYKCSTQGSLNVHMRVHTGEKPYFCSQCDYKSATSGALKSHYKVHSGESPYKCSECPKSFSKLGQLKTHKNSHTGDKMYRCPSCRFRSDIPEDISEHISYHDGIRSDLRSEFPIARGKKCVIIDSMAEEKGSNQQKDEETSDSSSGPSRPVFESGGSTAARSSIQNLSCCQARSSTSRHHSSLLSKSSGDCSQLQFIKGLPAFVPSLRNQLGMTQTRSRSPQEYRPESSSLLTGLPMNELPKLTKPLVGMSCSNPLASSSVRFPPTEYKHGSFSLQGRTIQSQDSKLSSLHSWSSPICQALVPMSQTDPFFNGYPEMNVRSFFTDQFKSSAVQHRPPEEYSPQPPTLYTEPLFTEHAELFTTYTKSSTIHPGSFPETPILRERSSEFSTSRSPSPFTNHPRPSRNHPGSATGCWHAPGTIRPRSPLSDHPSGSSSKSSPSSTPFACIFCDRLFSDMSILKDHIAAHSDYPKLGVTWPKFSVPFSFLDGFFPSNHLQDIYWNETGMPSRYNGFFSMFFGKYL